MKRIIYVLVSILILASSLGASEVKDNKKDLILNLESSNLEYNLGIIERGGFVSKIIKIRNRLDQPLVINEARSTCECIDIFIKPQILKKGEVLEAQIILDTSAINHEMEEVVYILTDNMDYELIRFVILATIIDLE